MRQLARVLWRHLPLVSALVVASLPGTTSASAAPAPPDLPASSEAPSAAAVPILMQANEGDLLGKYGLELDLPKERLATLLLETAPRSVFDDAQVVSIYGHPGICVMGELGCHPPEEAVDAARRLADEYQAAHDALGTGRAVRPAFHLIVDVAQAAPGDDGRYLWQLPLDTIAEYVEVTGEANVLLFLDIQIGWSDVMSVGVERLEPFLVEPHVHLAIDPEFATEPFGERPGQVLGVLDAPDVNAVQRYLAELVREHDLPGKILVLHQFQPGMLVNTDDYLNVPEVALTVDMDGYGAPGDKIEGYHRYALSEYAEHPAFKLFWEWDTPVLTPEEVLSLPTPPDYVIYQ